MRTLCLLAVLSACLFITQSSAQSLWINGGGNLVAVVRDPSGGFYVGVTKDIKKKKTFTFQPGLQYSYYRYSYRNLYGSENGFSIHAIQLPMSFRFDIGRWAGIGVGPQFNVIPRAVGKFRSDPTRPVTSSMSIVSFSGFIGPYFRINQRLAIELRAILDTQVFDSVRWDWRYIVIQSGVSWSITKPATE